MCACICARVTKHSTCQPHGSHAWPLQHAAGIVKAAQQAPAVPPSQQVLRLLKRHCPVLLLLLSVSVLLPVVHSTYDDPGLPCALLPLSFFWSEHTHHKNRWTMCAKDICFTNEFFRWGGA
jgi:hypothetical protein